MAIRISKTLGLLVLGEDAHESWPGRDYGTGYGHSEALRRHERARESRREGEHEMQDNNKSKKDARVKSCRSS